MNFLTPRDDRSDATPDASAEDVMASIRRILTSEEMAGPARSSPSQGLTRSAEPVLTGNALTSDIGSKMNDGADYPTDLAIPGIPPPSDGAAPGMIAPEAARAAAAAISRLKRGVAQNQLIETSRNGPTIEDVLREEVRPMLQEWLNRHLSAMVERLVRAELERLSPGAEP